MGSGLEPWNLQNICQILDPRIIVFQRKGEGQSEEKFEVGFSIMIFLWNSIKRKCFAPSSTSSLDVFTVTASPLPPFPDFIFLNRWGGVEVFYLQRDKIKNNGNCQKRGTPPILSARISVFLQLRFDLFTRCFPFLKVQRTHWTKWFNWQFQMNYCIPVYIFFSIKDIEKENHKF